MRGAAQIQLKRKVSKGPRAVGLLTLGPDGQARLVPIAIMIDGRFYDGQSYKADPVPMTLWPEVVYEGEKTGTSMGLFTVSGGTQNHETGEWVGDGHWITADELKKAASSKPKFGDSKPRDLDPDNGPPVLRHAGAKKPEQPEAGSGAGTASGASSSGSAASASSAGSQTTQSSPAPAVPGTAGSPGGTAGQTQSASTAADDETVQQNDPNRPTLKRGVQAPRPEVKDTTAVKIAANQPGPGASAATTASLAKAGKTATADSIPAISDEDGPPAQSYAYNLTPAQDAEFRQKLLAMATEELKAHDKTTAAAVIGATPKPATASGTGHPAAASKATGTSRPKAAAAKASGPEFKDVKMRVFDLTNGNEPTVVVMAKVEPAAARASGPATSKSAANSPSGSSSSTSGSGMERTITLVAREDINGDFHKVFSSVTDEKHLDVEPQWQLVDAVDANGDGNGELLFQKVSDSGSAYGIYRVIGDKLYPIFEGVAGSQPVVGEQ